MNNHQKEQQLEEQHLAQCLKIIQQNIHLYEDKESQYKKSPSVLPEGLLFPRPSYKPSFCSFFTAAGGSMWGARGSSSQVLALWVGLTVK